MPRYYKFDKIYHKETFSVEIDKNICKYIQIQPSSYYWTWWSIEKLFTSYTNYDGLLQRFVFGNVIKRIGVIPSNLQYAKSNSYRLIF